jgi:hypothetical protein
MDADKAYMTEQMAFEATGRFAVKMLEIGWPSLPGLLGGMQLINGSPSDPGVEEDWNEVVATINGSAPTPGVRLLSIRQAYEVAFNFLAAQFTRRGLETLTDVVARLESDDQSETRLEVMDDWQAALRLADNPPSENDGLPTPDSHFTFKEGRYFSYYDEKYFYAWLEAIEGVENVTGIEAGKLRVDLASPYLSRTGIFDLIALFTRYGYALTPLREHIAAEDLDYFKRPDARWYVALFGNDGAT